MILETPKIELGRLQAETGWELKPEGACKEDRCVPVAPAVVDLDAGTADAAMLADHLHMALVADEEHGLWALGPEAGGRALTSAQMPDLELPDREGKLFSLRSLRGTRVVMVAWASW